MIMNLKQKIQSEYTSALKAKEEVKKSTLSMLKAEITKVEKLNGNVELDNQSVIKVILSGMKQRKQSIEEFTKGNRADLVAQEEAELNILAGFLPKQMTEAEARAKISELITNLNPNDVKQKKTGIVMGQFNKEYTGLFDNKALKTLIEGMIP